MENIGLIEAVKANSEAVVKTLIAAGADVNQQDGQGWTPLNFAAGKGNLGMVTLLVDSGADVSKVGRDRRTPYMIALAAGRIEVAKYLQDRKKDLPGGTHDRERQYCKAYPLKDLRRFPSWSEQRINWKVNNDKDHTTAEEMFGDEKIVFIHQNFVVTESMWVGENVIFMTDDPAWREFCSSVLNFKVPSDFDLVTPSHNEGESNANRS